jgi:hypothetical protein
VNFVIWTGKFIASTAAGGGGGNFKNLNGGGWVRKIISNLELGYNFGIF